MAEIVGPAPSVLPLTKSLENESNISAAKILLAARSKKDAARAEAMAAKADAVAAQKAVEKAEERLKKAKRRSFAKVDEFKRLSASVNDLAKAVKGLNLSDKK